MRRVTQWRLALAAACLLAAGGTGPIRAADAEPGATPKDQSKANQRIYDALRDVINRGADLFNSGDHSGCYRLFQGSLMTVGAQLQDYPDLQKAIKAGLAEAEQHALIGARAVALRKVLDDIRATVNPRKTGGEKSKAAGTGAGKGTKTEAAPKPAATLWERLGGAENVRKVVDDFVDLAANDPKVNFSRNGKFKLDDAGVSQLKKELVDFVSAASGGPFKYTGKSMKEAHKDMGITNAEFNAIAADLKTALEMNGAKPDDVDKVLEAVGGTRKDIVEAAKPKPKKPEEKKPTETKAEDKKPGDKKPADKP